MVGLLLLAGGRSERMGTDKALLDNAMLRLVNEARHAGLTPIAVLAGPPPRGDVLANAGHLPEDVEVVDDPPGATCLHDAVVAALDGRWPAMLLCPCDAVLANADLFTRMVEVGPGVPVDEQGRRQALFAHLPAGFFATADLNQRTTALFDGLRDVNVGPLASHLASANTPEEHKALTASREANGA